MENKLIEWVRKEKQRLGLSYRELANYSNNTISNVHAGQIMEYKQPISEKFVFAMSIAFNMPIWEAFYMAGMLPEKANANVELLIKYEKMPPDRQKQILELIDIFSSKEKKED